MREHKQRVEYFRVLAICDCGGEMGHNGQCLTSNPPQYPHFCSICRKREDYNVIYPCIRYEVVE